MSAYCLIYLDESSIFPKEKDLSLRLFQISDDINKKTDLYTSYLIQNCLLNNVSTKK